MKEIESLRWLFYLRITHNEGANVKLTIQDITDRSEFYATNLAHFGVPLLQALTPKLGTVIFEGKSISFGSPNLPKDFDPFDGGFSGPRIWAEGCLGWIWRQWLAQTPKEKIQREVEFVVDRGIEMQNRCSDQHYRCLHDLWLLNCAILASGEKQLKMLAERVVDSNGDKSPPRNNGELFAAAWCGTLKYWILGDFQKALQQSEIIWGAYRYDIARVAPKPLVTKWLARDWKSFPKLQQKDFKTIWEFARKNKIIVSETESEIVIAFDRLPVPGKGWCWSHCGLALLAHRQGVAVATDAFWFPPYALECVPGNPQD